MKMLSRNYSMIVNTILGHDREARRNFPGLEAKEAPPEGRVINTAEYFTDDWKAEMVGKSAG